MKEIKINKFDGGMAEKQGLASKYLILKLR